MESRNVTQPGGTLSRDIVGELKAVADESRLRILCLLWEAEDLCSCEIERVLQLKQSNASRHLYRLWTAGLVTSYRSAQWTHYRIAEKHREPSGLVGHIVRTARAEPGSPYIRDAARYRDYRDRGFSCRTIHKWVPVEVHAD
jgi:ArsR family transcriptional regulator